MNRLDTTVKRRGKRYLIHPVVENIVGVVEGSKSRREGKKPIGVRVFHTSDS